MDEKRLCSGCGETKSLTKEHWYRNGPKYWKSVCKPCHTRQVQERSAANYAKLVAIKEASPCMDCGDKFLACAMQFDHRPGTGKYLHVGAMQSCSWERIQAEIDKCDLVCANCHAIRTWKRGRGEAT